MSTDAAARFLGELESTLWIDGGTGQSSSAPIFDAGRDGLRFFAAFGPPYARYTGTAFDFDRDIAARYDRQREIAFGRLHGDAEGLRALCSAMSETSLDFRDAAAPLFGSWEGTAAEQARDHFDGMLHSASSAWARLATPAHTIDSAVDGAERIAFDKARAMQALALDRIGGLDADQVELLVSCADEGSALTDARLAEIAALCHLRPPAGGPPPPGDVDANPAVCRTDRNLLDQVAADVRGWLDHAFVPAYQARAEAFDAVCAAAESDLAVAWNGLRAVLDMMAGQRFELDLPGSTLAAASAPVPPDTAAPIAGSVPIPPDGAAASAAAPYGVSAPIAVSGGSGGAAADAPPGSAESEPPAPGVRAGAGDTDMMRMEAAPTASAATGSGAAGVRGGPGGYGYGFFPVGGAVGAQGGGDRDHTRKVSITGDPIVSTVDDSLPEVLGADEDLEPEPSLEPGPEPPAKPDETFWELGEDGELRLLTKPAD